MKDDFVGFSPVPEKDKVGLYGGVCWQAKTEGTPSGSAATTGAKAVATCGTAQNYDLSVAKDFVVYLSQDSGGSYARLSIPDVSAGAADSEAVTAAEVVSALNASTMFGIYLTASVSSTKVKITSNAIGSNVKMYFSGAANLALGFTQIEDGSSVGGAGTPVEVVVKVSGPDGEAVSHVAVKVTLYNANTGTTKDSDSVIQTVTGDIVSGLHTNEAVIKTDSQGKLIFNIGDGSAVTNSCYVEYDADNAGYFLVSNNKVSRTAITTRS